MTQFPSLFPNALAEQNQPQPMSTQTYNPSMQTKPGGLFSQQTSNFGPQQQPFQQSPSANYQANPPYNYYPNQGPVYNTLPQSIIDQIRACAQSASPIFILPSSPASPSPLCQPVAPPTCIPYPMPMAIYPPHAQKASDNECKCSSSSVKSSRSEAHDRWDNNWSSPAKNECSHESWSKHQCKETTDGTICARNNCPATIQLQAMISQMLGTQGTVVAAVTRILLRNVAGSGVRDSIDDIMAIATRCLRQMSKDQLLRESKASQQLHALLGLFLTAQSTLPRVIPILTTAQLKANLLKAMVESLINAKLMESQGCGAEAPEALDALLLELKSDEEMRELLASLREKECEERVNVGFAPSNTQRLIAQSRLANVQRKIQQVEREMQRRRNGSGCTDWNRNVDVLQRHSAPVPLPQRYDSPDPFVPYRTANPKRLLLKPHVGSPDTTYQKPPEGLSSFCPKPQSRDENSSDEQKKCEKADDKDTKVKSEKTNKSECNCQIDDDCATEVEKEEACQMIIKEEIPDDCKTENTDCDEYDDEK